MMAGIFEERILCLYTINRLLKLMAMVLMYFQAYTVTKDSEYMKKCSLVICGS
jgi:hypothetical protein